MHAPSSPLPSLTYKGWRGRRLPANRSVPGVRSLSLGERAGERVPRGEGGKWGHPRLISPVCSPCRPSPPPLPPRGRGVRRRARCRPACCRPPLPPRGRGYDEGKIGSGPSPPPFPSLTYKGKSSLLTPHSPHTLRLTSSSRILPMASVGFSPLGQTSTQFMMPRQRYRR